MAPRDLWVACRALQTCHKKRQPIRGWTRIPYRAAVLRSFIAPRAVDGALARCLRRSGRWGVAQLSRSPLGPDVAVVAQAGLGNESDILGVVPLRKSHREGISVGSASPAPGRKQVRPKGPYELVKRGIGLCLCSSRRLAQHSTRRLCSAGSLALPATGRPSRACRASSLSGQRAMRRRDRWRRR